MGTSRVDPLGHWPSPKIQGQWAKWVGLNWYIGQWSRDLCGPMGQMGRLSPPTISAAAGRPLDSSCTFWRNRWCAHVQMDYLTGRHVRKKLSKLDRLLEMPLYTSRQVDWFLRELVHARRNNQRLVRTAPPSISAAAGVRPARASRSWSQSPSSSSSWSFSSSFSTCPARRPDSLPGLQIVPTKFMDFVILILGRPYPTGQRGHNFLMKWADPWPRILTLGPWGRVQGQGRVGPFPSCYPIYVNCSPILPLLIILKCIHTTSSKTHHNIYVIVYYY